MEGKFGELKITLNRKDEFSQIALVQLREKVRERLYRITGERPADKALDSTLYQILTDPAVINFLVNSVTYHIQ
jgi:hypothetical protein